MYIVVGSSTTAQRLRKAVERSTGHPASVVHTPAAISAGGCSYSLRVDDRMINDIKNIIDSNNISSKKIYIEKKEKGEKVYYALS